MEEYMSTKAFEYIKKEFPDFNKEQQAIIAKVFLVGFMEGCIYKLDELSKKDWVNIFKQ